MNFLDLSSSIQLKIPVMRKNFRAINDLPWPYQNATVMSFMNKKDEVMTFSPVYVFGEQDTEADWTTIVNIDDLEMSRKISDFRHLDKEFCCPGYTKPLDFDLRYYEKTDDNIEVVQCDKITKKEFEEKFVRTQTPVKIKGCKIDDVDTKDLKWWNGVALTPEDSLIQKMLSNDEVVNLQKNGAVLRFKSDYEGKIDWPDFLPENIATKAEEAEIDNFVHLRSAGTGNPLVAEPRDVIDVQFEGSKWWTIVPPGTVLQPRMNGGLCKSCSSESAFHPIWSAAAWFDHMQPQFSRDLNYDRSTIQTVQKPGEIIYVPGDSGSASYSITDGKFLQNFRFTLGNVEAIDQASYKLSSKLTSAVDVTRAQLGKENSQVWKDKADQKETMVTSRMFN